MTSNTPINTSLCTLPPTPSRQIFLSLHTISRHYKTFKLGTLGFRIRTMASSSSPILIDEINNKNNNEDDDDTMLIDNEEEDQEEEDAFIRFVDHARSILSSEDEENSIDGEDEEGRVVGPSWNWIVSRILKTCSAYSSGVTSAILLSDLSQTWSEQYRAPRRPPECITQLKKKKHMRRKLPNTVTIDSIYEKNFLSVSSILEAVIVDVYVLPGTNIYMLSLEDFWSSSTIDLYLHRRYYDLVNLESPDNGILKRGREIFLSGCCVRATHGSGRPPLLPTEYIVILLDENQDEDAMLLGAQFCSDDFSSISISAVNNGASYSFYARIQSIGSLEIQGEFGSLQRKQIGLVDSDGVKINFLLWGEQLLLANLFSVGSMLALDKPFISSAAESNIQTTEEFCLEYGTATQLYLVPFIQQGEQICLTSTQNRHQGSRALNGLNQTQALKVSQVTLPCDSQGTVDFSNCPFRLFIMDLRDKMTSISLYGTVTDIFRENITAETIFVLRIEDVTGAVVAKLHFVKSWSLGRLSFGHTIYISGLACHMTSKKTLELSWFEKDSRASLVNISCLPALLNSPCLHKLSYLSNISSEISITHVCSVWLDHVEPIDLISKVSHVVCGHFANEKPDGFVECEFCNGTCFGEVMPTFHLKANLADESAKVSAWCTGQTAAELLQISAKEFYELTEEDQALYLYTLEKQRFMVAIVNCKRQVSGNLSANCETGLSTWEITGALKCE